MANIKSILSLLSRGHSDSFAAGNHLADLLEHQPDLVEPIVNERVRAYYYLATMRRLLRRFNINMIIDAGAHSGQFAGPMYGFCGFQGQMHSFEPVAEFYAKLEENTKHYSGWKAYHLAVGDEPGRATIFVGANHGGTSSLLRSNGLLERFIPDCTLGSGQEVNVVRLDQHLKREFESSENTIMLKSDTQGFEKKVMLSCGQYLSRISLLHLELSSIPVYAGQEGMSEMLSFIEESGFIPIYIANNYAPEPGFYIDFDVVCVNKSLV